MLSDEKITWFQNLYKRHVGKEINREDAKKLGSEMVTLAELMIDSFIEQQKKEKQQKEALQNDVQ